MLESAHRKKGCEPQKTPRQWEQTRNLLSGDDLGLSLLVSHVLCTVESLWSPVKWCPNPGVPSHKAQAAPSRKRRSTQTTAIQKHDLQGRVTYFPQNRKPPNITIASPAEGPGISFLVQTAFPCWGGNKILDNFKINFNNLNMFIK